MRRAIVGLAVSLLVIAPGSLPAQKKRCPPLDSLAPWAMVNRAWSRDTAAARTDEALRLRLLALAAKDQEIRRDFGTRMTDSSYARQLLALDDSLAAEVLEILDRVGLPTRRMVGSDGSDAFMLVVQHNWSLQERVLALARQAAPGEISPQALAMLEDRVLVHQGKAQRFGTQFNATGDGVFHFARTVALDGLEERRARAGLPPMDQYVCMLEEAGMKVDHASLPAPPPR